MSIVLYDTYISQIVKLPKNNLDGTGCIDMVCFVVKCTYFIRNYDELNNYIGKSLYSELF